MDALLEESAREQAVLPQTAVQPEPEPLPINLHNRAAVRAALLSCLMALLLGMLLGPFNMGLLALFLAGFFAVFLYRKRTGQPVSVVNGMRLGWIAGVFVFTLVIVVVVFMAIAISQPEIAEQVREQMIKSSYPADDIAKLFESLQKPSGLAMLLVGSFVSSILPMGIGAAAGALLLNRR